MCWSTEYYLLYAYVDYVIICLFNIFYILLLTTRHDEDAVVLLPRVCGSPACFFLPQTAQRSRRAYHSGVFI